MATITFSDSAPKDLSGPVHFTFGSGEFDLESGKSFETEDADILSGAVTNTWLKVEFPVENVEVASGYDPNDPHDNPAVDHLSPYASDATKKAVAETEQAIMDEAYPEDTPNVLAEYNITPDAPASAPADPAPVVAPAVTPTNPVAETSTPPAPAAAAPTAAPGGSA